MAREVINLGTRPNSRDGDTYRAAMGKVNRMTEELYAAVDALEDAQTPENVLTTTDVVNVLTSTATDAPLSAAQGKALKDAIDAFTGGGDYPVVIDDDTTGGTTNAWSAERGKQIRTDFTALQSTVSSLSTSVNTNTLAIADNASDISSLETTVATHTSQIASLSAATFPVVYVSGLSNGADITDTLAAAIAANPNGAEIIIQRGSFNVRMKNLIIPSNTWIRGAHPGATTLTGITGTTVSAAYNHCIFSIAPSTVNVRITDLKCAGPDRYHAVVIARGVDGLRIEGVDSGNICLLWTQRTARNLYDTYASMNSTTMSRNIHIAWCRGSGGAAIVGETNEASQWVEYRFCYTSSIRDCIAYNYRYGFQAWGGDSNNAAESGSNWISGERKSWAIRAQNCHFTDMEATLWMSMTKDSVVQNCVLERSNDVTLDFEGCANIVCRDTVARDGKAGTLATFFGSSNILIENCTIENTDATVYPHLYKAYHNLGGSVGMSARLRDIVIRGCTFKSLSFGSGGMPAKVSDEAGPIEGFIFEHNKLIDARLEISANNNRDVTVRYNTIEFRTAATSAFSAAHFNRNQRGSDGITNTLVVNDNVVLSRVSQPSGSYAFRIRQEGFAVPVHMDVCRNRVRGAWTQNFRFENAMSNVASVYSVNFRDNSLANGGTWEIVSTSTDITASVNHSGNYNERHGTSADYRITGTVDLAEIPAGATSAEQTITLPAGIAAPTSQRWIGSLEGITNGNRLEIDAWVTTAPTPTVAGTLTWTARNKDDAAINLASGTVRFRPDDRI